MSARRVLVYFAWSRPAETGAPLTVIEDRFPALFELRRLFYPRFEAFARAGIDQGVGGFLDHVQRPNFAAFVSEAESATGRAARVVERVADEGAFTPIDAATLNGIDTLLVLSFDSLRTRQAAATGEIEAAADFLADPDHLMLVCPHHDIGGVRLTDKAGLETEHKHHGDPAIPPRQGFGGFARSLLAGLGVPVENRYGLRPAVKPDGTPEPFLPGPAADRLGLLADVGAFNSHPHLPHFERLGAAQQSMEVLVRQRIDATAPPHPYQQSGRVEFNSLLQSQVEAFSGTLLVGDATLFSSTAGGADQLQRFWSNILRRPARS